MTLLIRLFIILMFLFSVITAADNSKQTSNETKDKVIVEQKVTIDRKVIILKNIKDYAKSADGRYLLLVHKQSQALEIIYSSDFSFIKAMPLANVETTNTKIDFVFSANFRQSFIVGLGGRNELWEVLYKNNPLPVYNGVMHDYRLGEGLVRDQSNFPIRIISVAKTNIPISSFYFYPHKGLLFLARDKTIEVIQLDARQTIASIPFKMTPNLLVSRIDTIKDTPHLFVTFLEKQGVTIINMKSWEIIEPKLSVN